MTLEVYCSSLTDIGSFFIWIIYAIGACLVPISESSTEVSSTLLSYMTRLILESKEYFCRARIYIPIVMSAQNMDTVQALLCLVQYSFRAQVRHFVALTSRQAYSNFLQNDSPLW
jgi:hypothetical protein